MERRILFLLLIVTFFKGIVWLAFVPLWHFPDEQAHFAQVQNFAEFGETPKGHFTTSREILVSERLLGTERDWQGKNKFTHHPEYKVEYTDGLDGKFEKEIINFPKEYRWELVKQEATNYPPLYYQVASSFYKFFYEKDLITRVFTTRFLSIFLLLGTIFFVFKIAKVLFPQSKVVQTTLPILVSFQPMFTFVSSGVSSDNLMNFLFTLFIFLSLKVVQTFRIFPYILFLGVNFYLGMLTKPHFNTAFLLTPFLLLVYLFKEKHNFLPRFFFLTTLLLFAFFFTFRESLIIFSKTGLFAMPDVIFPLGGREWQKISFWEHLVWSIRHTIAEVLPWYWGVFKWLSITLPAWTHRLIARVMILAVLGLGIKSISFLKKGKKQLLIFLFLIYTTVVYFLALTFWDWFFRMSHGFSLGMQGRYFFPAISSHLSLLLIGLVSLFPKDFVILRNWVAKILALFFVFLNFVGLYTVVNSYYDLSNLEIFFLQASQYKPIVFKTPYLEIWLVLYLFSLLLFLAKFVKIKA